jgi:hypothetical protein
LNAKTKVIEDGFHDSLVVVFQWLQIAQLNEALKTCGVADGELRQKICETYFFHSGYFLDACWFREEGRRFKPGVYFAELDRDRQPTGAVYLPDPEFGTIHEYAIGAVSSLFEDHQEDVSEIEVGSVY